jgi:hypothetical protein
MIGPQLVESSDCDLKHVMCMFQLPGCADNANIKKLKHTYTSPHPYGGESFD